MSRRLTKLLVANRGEIALRVIRTCREMNIPSVAIYSRPDRFAPFVRAADESYLVGDAPSSESYLHQENVIGIAKRAKCDAIHPGYGFLSENSSFVKRLEQERIIFVGPSADAIQNLGNKTSARLLARSLGIPTVPGTMESIPDEKRASEAAAEIGYPIMLKAAGGGGGKGMKIVMSTSDITSAFRSARSEARSAFGDERIYIEKYLENPRHIEVQVLADTRGDVVHLGERECSIQRRHQKLIEESPANHLNIKTKDSLYDAAIELVRKGNYTNAGTVEFLLDEAGNFYFLEMNTRLQVEHPVTELRTGIDIVREQIQIASGQRLSYTQKDIVFNGNSIECRICAEDPMNNFFPSTGTIMSLRPAGGVGIREDRGVEEGTEITPYYDSLLSKLVAWGRNREEARRRMARALQEYHLYGLRNNLALLQWVITHPQFRKGAYSTNFLECNFDAMTLSTVSEDETHLAAILTVLQSTTAPSKRANVRRLVRSSWLRNRLDAMR